MTDSSCGQRHTNHRHLASSNNCWCCCCCCCENSFPAALSTEGFRMKLRSCSWQFTVNTWTYTVDGVSTRRNMAGRYDTWQRKQRFCDTAPRFSVAALYFLSVFLSLCCGGLSLPSLVSAVLLPLRVLTGPGVPPRFDLLSHTHFGFCLLLDSPWTDPGRPMSCETIFWVNRSLNSTLTDWWLYLRQAWRSNLMEFYCLEKKRSLSTWKSSLRTSLILLQFLNERPKWHHVINNNLGTDTGWTFVFVLRWKLLDTWRWSSCYVT